MPLLFSYGTLQQRDINQDYVDRIAGDVQIDRPLRVVVDAGNGVAGELGPRVLAAIGAEVTPLYCEMDGTFPNHHPDPSEPHNLADLIKMVRQLDADLGIAFDGDLPKGAQIDALRAQSTTVYEVQLSGPPPVLDGVPGVVSVTAVDGGLRVAQNGPPGPLLAALAAAPVTSLRTRERHLEEVFLSYYGEDA